MGVKLEGFLCDNCRTFRIFGGVMLSPDNLDVDLGVPESKEESTLIEGGFGYVKEPGWHYYNVVKIKNMGDEWIRWTDKSKCYCSKCDRTLKLKKLISKI